MLFYWFAVQYYDVWLQYEGTKYLLIADDSGCCVCLYDNPEEELGDDYPTANDLIKNFKFPNGAPLLDLAYTKEIYVDIY